MLLTDRPDTGTHFNPAAPSAVDQTAVLTLPSQDVSVAALRHFTDDLLRHWGITEDDRDSAVLIVDDPAANAVPGLAETNHRRKQRAATGVKAPIRHHLVRRRRGRKPGPISDEADVCHRAWLKPVRSRLSACRLTLDDLVSLTGYS
ncbi:hypothetical protein [Streptomyces sp. SD15]